MLKGFNSWKVLVYAKGCSDQEGQFKEEICVEFETSIWKRTEERPYIWHRTKRNIVELSYKICRLDEDNKSVVEIDEVDTAINSCLYAQEGIIHFKDGHFLKIEGLSPPPSQNPHESTPGFDRARSEYRNHKDSFSARNIHAETTFCVAAGDKSRSVLPLFYLDQEKDDHGICNHAMRFGEIHTPDEETDINYRQVYWQISGQHSIETEKFRIENDNNDTLEYTLTISQDKDRRLKIDDPHKSEEAIQEELDNLPVYFEFYADSVPLPMAELDSADDLIKIHTFDSNPRLFYIGYDPELNATFEGSLRRLMFDPNSACDGC